ncbi:hypothetical protein AAVH_30622, partial [Aphelenchoides avenae]
MEPIALLMLLTLGTVKCLTPAERDQVIAEHHQYRQQLVQFFNKEGKPVMAETSPM